MRARRKFCADARGLTTDVMGDKPNCAIKGAVDGAQMMADADKLLSF